MGQGKVTQPGVTVRRVAQGDASASGLYNFAAPNVTKVYLAIINMTNNIFLTYNARPVNLVDARPY